MAKFEPNPHTVD